MGKWSMSDFEDEIKKAGEQNKNLSAEEDDRVTRQARYMQAKHAYESITEEERMQKFFSYKDEINIKDEVFTYFWITKSPFSQWHLSDFKLSFVNTINPKNPEDNREHLFSSAEQYMMYAKSMLFLDRDVASKILQTNDVRKIKALGRTVKYFQPDVWDFNKVHIVYDGNMAKFTQNEDLKQALFETKGTTLVEAAPNDPIWGIGLEEDDPRAKKRETWLGKNLLGEVLTQLRVEMMGEY